MSESLDTAAQRQIMLDEQLAQRGITSPWVLQAIERVPREEFVPEAYRAEAYADRALPIDCEQTISQPYIVGLMTQSLQLQGTEHVLEIGTGSGYQTAILAQLARTVTSIERHPELSMQAAGRMARLGYRNVALVVGDGTLGWPENAPYDRILVAAAAERVPPRLFEQLRDGGWMIIPLGPPGDQVLQCVRKVDGRPSVESLANCRFVPLVGEGT